MNRIYIIRKMTEEDYYDGEFNIPVTTIVEEAQLISTIIPADGSNPFYEVVPVFTIDNYKEIRDQKPIFSNRQGIKRPINSIYVNEIFSSETIALETSYNRNRDIIEKRNEGFKRNQYISNTIQFELDNLQERVREYHELEKRLNPELNEETIDYYTYLLDEKFKRLKESTKNKDNKGRKLVYENKDDNQWYYL